MCRPVITKSADANLPIFLFVAGVEGSGHHALVSVWESLVAQGVNLELVVFDQKFHALGIENHASYHYSSIDLDAHRRAMAPLFEAAAKRSAIVVDAQNSYPMGYFAGSLAHPDLDYLRRLDGELFDLRVIVLYRNPVDAALSAVRRFHNCAECGYKTPEFQARMVSESLVNINNNLPSLPCGKWMVLEYESFVQRPQQLAGPLARLLGLPQAKLASAFDKIKPPPKRQDNGKGDEAQTRKVLEDFFRRQKSLWPLLVSAVEGA